MWNKWSTWILSRCSVWTVLMIIDNKKYQNIINIMNHSLSLSLYCYNSLAHFITDTNTHTRTYKHTPVDTHKCLLSSGAVDKTERRDHQNACCWTLLRQSLIAQPKSLWVPSCCFLLRLLHSLCLFFPSYKLSYLFLFLFFFFKFWCFDVSLQSAEVCSVNNCGKANTFRLPAFTTGAASGTVRVGV